MTTDPKPRRPPARPRRSAVPADGVNLSAEAEQILNAIRGDEVDALVVRKGASEAVFALTNVNDLRQADATRLALERRFDTLAANAPVGIFINNFAGNCLYLNRRGCEIVGLSTSEALGDGVINAVHPEDRERLRSDRARATAAGMAFEGEYRFGKPGGRIVWVAARSAPLVGEDGNSLGRIGTLNDVTERKLAEDALRENRAQLQEMLKERERMTQDLHDGCIQSIYAIGMNLQSVRQKLDASPEAARVVASAAANLNLVIQELRSFISARGVGPRKKPDLEHEIGRAGQAARDQGLAFDMDIDRRLAGKLTAEIALHIVQIAREAISNATRHASAKSLHVSLRALDGSICLEIHDDGIGFDTHVQEKRGLGLHHIDARASALRGQARILSTPGNGTCVLVQVPMSR
jgi:PAS domain S-box-containing protein